MPIRFWRVFFLDKIFRKFTILFFGYYYIFLIILFFELLSFFKTISELLIIVPERVNLKPSIDFMYTFFYSLLFFWRGEGGGGEESKPTTGKIQNNWFSLFLQFFYDSFVPSYVICILIVEISVGNISRIH